MILRSGMPLLLPASMLFPPFLVIITYILSPNQKDVNHMKTGLCDKLLFRGHGPQQMCYGPKRLFIHHWGSFGNATDRFPKQTIPTGTQWRNDYRLSEYDLSAADNNLSQHILTEKGRNLYISPVRSNCILLPFVKINGK